ncbi:hypothetical protein TWF730_005032 [Orbilia blumenaviensis]|uniref:Secreted protein n=1 Tax=Orbilia blumenaviensis TaxID=1796055 RepID=A0AAV9VH28_9PEZI
MLISKLVCSILAVGPTLSFAHSIIISATGDADKTIKGYAFGMVEGTSRIDTTQYSGQRDAVVFSFPTIPDRSCKKCIKRQKPKCMKCVSSCWRKKYGKRKNRLRLLRRTNQKKKKAAAAKPKKAAKKKAKAKKAKSKGKKTGKCHKYVKNCKRCAVYDFNCRQCRTPLPTGCGRTFMVQQSELYTIDGGAQARKMCCGAKSPFYGLGALNINGWANKMAKNNEIPRVCSGGHLELKIHQVNADGAGPYQCVLDKTGSGVGFPTSLQIIGKNVPGKYGRSKYKLKNWKLRVQIPENPGCSGSYGSVKNVCFVRCHNAAPNGPFGGCIPFQLVGGKPTPPSTDEDPIPPEDEDAGGEEELPDEDEALVKGKTVEDDDGSDETANLGPVGVDEVDDADAVEEDDNDNEGYGDDGDEDDEEEDD